MREKKLSVVEHLRSFSRKKSWEEGTKSKETVDFVVMKDISAFEKLID